MNKTTRPELTNRVRPLAARGLALPCLGAALLLAACGSDNEKSGGAKTGATDATTQAPSGAKDHGTTDVSGKAEAEVELDDNYFAPTVLTGKPGQTVTLKLRNEGKAEHTFTLAAQKIDKELQPGGTAVVRVKLPQTGSVQFTCRYHVKLGMRGSLRAGGTSARSPSSSGGSVGGGY